MKKMWALLISNLIASLSLAVVKPKKEPFLRFSGPLHHPAISKDNQYLAFQSADEMGLKVVDLKTREVVTVTDHKVSPGFFWAPGGFRLIYEENYLNESHQAQSEIKAYDRKLDKSIAIRKSDGAHHWLSFDPRDYRFYFTHKGEIIPYQLKYPGKRLSAWHLKMQSKKGYWVVGKSKVIWATHKGVTTKIVSSGNTPIHSFDISPDGLSIVWSNSKEKVFLSEEGKKPRLIGFGLDPKWHPKGTHFVYAHARKLGHKVVDHDIRIVNRRGFGRFLTRTFGVDERYPIWLNHQSSLLYTPFKSTDIFEMSFKL